MFSCPLHQWYSPERQCPVCSNTQLITTDTIYPLTQEQDGQEELLWGEVLHIIGAYKPAFTNELKTLQNKFSITRKQTIV